MLSFACDYLEGAHEKVLQRLMETNREQLPGYGEDIYCQRAAEKIRAACRCENADVHLLVGGTQTNQVVIDSLLAGYQGVIAADTGHINVHEAGAIEFTGHKVLALPQTDGKLAAETLRDYLKTFWADESCEHMVIPGMVYISYPTEYGTLYSKAELQALSDVCRTCHIPLYLDGARLGYGLAAQDDMTMADIASLCDVFYIGGTKVGALCGEAVVFTHGNTPPHFLTSIKQHGALLAKRRLVGVQFDALFTDGLYTEISRHAIRMARRMKAMLQEKGYAFYLDSPTNQQFVILTREQKERLEKTVGFSVWALRPDGSAVVRFATSWATTDEQLDMLEKML